MSSQRIVDDLENPILINDTQTDVGAPQETRQVALLRGPMPYLGHDNAPRERLSDCTILTECGCSERRCRVAKR